MIENEDLQGAFKAQPMLVTGISITYNDSNGCMKALYEFDIINPTLKVVAETSDEHDAIEILDRAGLCPTRVEFSPASADTSKFRITSDDVIVKGETEERLPIRKSTSDKDFEEWFVKCCSLLNESVLVVPDTNFLRRKYHTNYFHSVLKAHKEIQFVLSRLSIIEVENKYNTNTKTMKSLKKIQSPKPEQQQALARAATERRIAFHTMNEIIRMKRAGIGMLMPLDNGKIKGFTDASGEDLADPWIRTELLEFIANGDDEGYRVGASLATGDKMVPRTCIFITADKMNALASTADNLDTFYISRDDDVREVSMTSERGTPHILNFATLVVNTALHFGESEIHLVSKDGKSNTVKIFGDWGGKSANDWQNENVRASK